MRYKWMALFPFLFSLSAAAAELNSYECTPADDSHILIHLEDYFSAEENMRMGSLTLLAETIPARVYQFLMPDNERYIQMWYGGSELHVDAQFAVSSDNLKFAATLTQAQVRRPLNCYKN